MSSRITFIDSNIDNYQTLISQLPSDSNIVVLDANRDGVMQILAALQNRIGLNAIDIISHGAPGALTLGSGELNSGNIADYADQLAEIGQHLTSDGDLLLYGCNVAQGDRGSEFIAQLAQLTGADVAASVDMTGHSELGGNWKLEQNIGQIETTAIESDSYTVFPMSGTGLADIPQQIDESLTNWLHEAGAYFATLVYGDTNLGASMPSTM